MTPIPQARLMDILLDEIKGNDQLIADLYARFEDEGLVARGSNIHGTQSRRYGALLRNYRRRLRRRRGGE